MASCRGFVKLYEFFNLNFIQMNTFMKGMFVAMLVLGTVAFAQEGKHHTPKEATQTRHTTQTARQDPELPCPPICTVDYIGHY